MYDRESMGCEGIGIEAAIARLGTSTPEPGEDIWGVIDLCESGRESCKGGKWPPTWLWLLSRRRL